MMPFSLFFVIVTALAFGSSSAAFATTYAVTKTADTNDGACDADCSLREAMTAANASTATPHTVQFAIPSTDSGCSGSTCTISPTSQLPSLTRGQTTLDGTTQSGYVANTTDFPSALNGTLAIVLNGSSAGTSRGLKITSANNVVKGIVVRGFGSTGIEVSGSTATGNEIQGCYVGVDATGESAAGNAGVGGVYLASGNNVLGTDGDGANDAAERNLISGNTGSGVAVSGNSNRVSGNFIGTDKDGESDLGNTKYGFTVSGDSNVLGTNGDETYDAAEGNLVSGNDSSGYYLGTSADDNVITASRIGTNASGTSAVANTQTGIYNAGNRTLIGAHATGGAAENEGNVISGNLKNGIQINNGTGIVIAGNLIGTGTSGLSAVANGMSGVMIYKGTNRVGTDGDSANDEAESNVISGNGYLGVYISGSGTTGNTVAGNNIGVGSDGSTALPNGSHGVGVYSASTGNVIGGDTEAEGNVIANNGDAASEYGVSIGTSTCSGNRILYNSLFDNEGYGIKLATGANGSQTAPTIASQSGTGASYAISGTTPNAGDTVQLFVASSDGEGRTYVGQAVADAAKNWSVTAGSSYSTTGGTFVTTATDSSGNTSAFSSAYTAVAANSAPVADDLTVYAGTGFTADFTLTATDADSGDVLTYSYTSVTGVSGTAPSLSYAPSGIVNETTTFEFTVTDSAGASDTGTVTLAPAASPIRIGAGGFTTRLYQDPSDPDACWATSDVGGLFYSEDACRTFEPKNASFWRDDHFSIDDVLVDTGDPDTVYAIGGTYALSNSYPGTLGCCLWKSTDRGESFSPLLRRGDGACNYYSGSTTLGFDTSCTGGTAYLRLDGRKDEELYSSTFSSSDRYGARQLADGKRLATDPSSCASGACQTLYVADFNKGVYKSLDGGENFSQLPLPAITSSSSNLRVSSINLLPYTSGGATQYLILVGARFHNPTSSKLTSTSTYSDGSLYLGFNGGEDPTDWVTLTPSSSSLTDIRDIAVDPALELGTIDANDVIHMAAGKAGIVMGTFTALDATVPSAAITFSYASNCGLAAAGSYGTGLDFETTCDESISTSTYVAVEADPANGDNLYATSLSQGDGQVYHSTDGGTNWTALVDTSDMSNFDYNDIWFNQHYWKVASFASTVTFTGRDANGNESASGDGVAFSDFWSTWQTPNDGSDAFTAYYQGIENVVFMDVAADPFDPQRLYLAVLDHAFFTSEDGGESVTLRGSGGSTPYPTYSGIAAGLGYGHAIAFSNAEAAGGYADRVFLSTNNNTTQGGKLYESSDGGETFTDIGGSAGLPVGFVKAIAYDAANVRLYVTLNTSTSVVDASGTAGADANSGLYCLERSGSSWSATQITAFTTALGETGSDVFSQTPKLDYHSASGRLFVMHNSNTANYRLLIAYTPGTSCSNGTATAVNTSVILDGTSRAKLQALAVDPTDANKIYLGTYEQGLWYSADGGTNWTQYFFDPDSASASARSSTRYNRSVSDIVIHPSDPNLIFVGGQANYYDDSGGSYYGVKADVMMSGSYTYYDPGVVLFNLATGSYTDLSAAIAPFGRDVQTLFADTSEPYRLLVGTTGQGGVVLHLEDIVDWSGTALER